MNFDFLENQNEEPITTEEQALAILKEFSYKFYFFPEEIKTEKVCLTAVQYWGGDLKYVPNKYKTPELCLLAVQDYGEALEYVPGKLKTAELCLLAVQNEGTALKHVPGKLKTPELCLIAVKKFWAALKFVPKELKTVELCQIAVRKERCAIKYVPKELKNSVNYIGMHPEFVSEKNKVTEFSIESEPYFSKTLYKEHKTIILKPIFSSDDYDKDLIFINCTLGYDGNINLLFANKKYKLIIPETKKVIELNNKEINYTHGLQIDSEKYCFVCKSTSDNFQNRLDKNCHIFNSKEKLLNEFYIGTGVKTIQTITRNKMWVSYNDVGCTSNKNDFSWCALVYLDDKGEVFHRYGLGMIECECFNVISKHDLVVNTYPAKSPHSFAYNKITGGVVEKIIGCDTPSKFIAVQDDLILSVNKSSISPHQDFSLFDINDPDKKLPSFEFFSTDGEKLTCVHAQKDTLYFWKNNKLYKSSINKILS